MENLSPRRTGNFAAAYRNGTESCLSETVPVETPLNINNNSPHRQNLKNQPKSILKNNSRTTSVDNRTRNEIVEDWSETTPPTKGILQNPSASSKDKTEEIPSIVPNVQSDIQDSADSKKDKLNINEDQILENPDADVKSEKEDYNNISIASQATLPCEESSELPEETPAPAGDSEEDLFPSLANLKPVSTSSRKKEKRSSKQRQAIKNMTPAQSVDDCSKKSRKEKKHQQSLTKPENPRATRLPPTITTKERKQSSRSEYQEARDSDEAVNMQLIENMDNVDLHNYLDWLWKNYSKLSFNSHSSADIKPLLQKILGQPEVYYMMSRKITEIRENLYYMETKSTPELFQMVSDVVKKIVQADLKDVSKVYRMTLELFQDR